ncbi:ferredoxin [Streptomyces sp. NPDC059816]|uniref:ferredoxin n=1 Tax=Streptomyces sp. NPDC059816 TaxID=3346960 RepID=UPI003651A2EC
MRVNADRERCMAAGHCAVTVPAVFDHGDDGLVVVLDPKPDEDVREEIERAVDLCPSRALSLATE